MISKLVIATRNPNKVKEISSVLKHKVVELLSLNEFPEIPEVIEDGTTFVENARKKALTIFRATGLPSLADDSGLEVDFLGGKPGVFSSRFSGENATDAENNKKLLELLADVSENNRSARFRCVMVFIDDKREKVIEGKCEGIILTAARGKNGFGYDPLFYLPALQKTFAEIEMTAKNQISHRGRALAKLQAALNF